MPEGSRIHTYMAYTWPYLMEIEPRASMTFEVLRPFLAPRHRVVLDLFCGFAPLYERVSAHLPGCEYRGFDCSVDAVSHLRARHPGGLWELARDEEFSFRGGVDVMLHLGVSAGERATDSKIEPAVDGAVLRACRPSVVMLETSSGHYDRIRAAGLPHHWDAIVSDVESLGYELAAAAEFDAGLSRAIVSVRKMRVYALRTSS